MPLVPLVTTKFSISMLSTVMEKSLTAQFNAFGKVEGSILDPTMFLLLIGNVPLWFFTNNETTLLCVITDVKLYFYNYLF